MEKRRILIVDNNDELRVLLEQALGRLGHEVIVTGDREKALRRDVHGGRDGGEGAVQAVGMTARVAQAGMATGVPGRSRTQGSLTHFYISSYEFAAPVVFLFMCLLL